MIQGSVASILVKYLVDYGIDTAFGIPGLYNMPLFEAMRTAGINVITVRHEQGAAFMADGYARATGRPAVVATLPGCGVLNAMTGLSEAYGSSVPVLLLNSQIQTEWIDANVGKLHELTGQLAVVDSVMKYSEQLLDPQQLHGTTQRILTELGTGRYRPVQLELPLNVQEARVSAPEDIGLGWAELAGKRSQDSHNSNIEQTLHEALTELAGCKRPVIIAGGGVVSSNATAELTLVAERLGAPVLTTGMGSGAISSKSPLATGVTWIASADMREFVKSADAVLAIGTRFNEGLTHGWDLDFPECSIRIDIDPAEIERNIPTKHHIVSDAKYALLRVEAWLEQNGIDRHGAVDGEFEVAQKQFKSELSARVGTTRPWMNALRAALPQDSIIAADMCLFWADMLGTFPIQEPRSVLFPWGMGTLGFGIPAAIGAKIGRPEAPVVAIVGDGAFQFTGTELGTAVQQGLTLPIIVANNSAYGMIKMQQTAKYGEDCAVNLTKVDFVKFAEAYGASGIHVKTPAEFESALKDALNRQGPTVIELPWRQTFADPEESTEALVQAVDAY